MVRSEAEVERLVSENQKLVQLGVNRYLKRYFVGTMEREDLIERLYYESIPVARLAEELSLSRQTVYARQRMALRLVRAVLSSAVTAGILCQCPSLPVGKR